MKFFNRKEEVIDIQLTQDGKRLLSQGRWDPVYYAFFDDDVIYDGENAGVQENQNDAETRIKETPRTKVQHTFAGVDLTGENQNYYDYMASALGGNADSEWFYTTLWYQKTGLFLKIFPDYQKLPEYGVPYEPIMTSIIGLKSLNSLKKNDVMIEPLGHSSHGVQKHPAWSIRYFHGKLTGSIEAYRDTIYNHILRIPQLSSSLENKSYITYIDPATGVIKKNYIEKDSESVFFKTNLDSLKELAEEGSSIDPAGAMKPTAETPTVYFGGPYPDGSLIQQQSDYLLLHILEKNVDFLKENFEIEVFRKRVSLGQTAGEHDIDHPTRNHYYEQLYFFDPKIDEQVAPGHVEYWFDILVDEEIPSKAICDNDLAASTLSKKQHKLNDKIIECDDEFDAKPKNIYASEVIDIEEPC